MTNQRVEISVVRRIEVPEPGPSATEALPTLEDLRLEDWIASNLDENSSRSPSDEWHRLIGGIPRSDRIGKDRRGGRNGEKAGGGWARFRVAYRRGITVVRLADRGLVKESELREFNRDLVDLIDAGNHRIVLNFSMVERLGSWVVGAVGEAHRRCVSADGGCLKICGLQPQLAEIFSIVGLSAKIGLFPDEAAAIEGHWPEPSSPRPLPIAILEELAATVDLPPIRGGSPGEAAPALACDDVCPEPPHSRHQALDFSLAEDGVWLRVEGRGTKRRLVAVSSKGLLIGRDQGCRLRLGSPQVSKRHAAIERRKDGIFLIDLGSTNGTFLNGQPLRSQARMIKDGDRIQIGPIVCKLVVGPRPERHGEIETMVAEWIQGDNPRAFALQDEVPSTEVVTTLDAIAGEPRIKVEVIQDAVVMTPITTELQDTASLGLLREQLHALIETSVPRRVVINLEFVGHVTAQAIGVILAFHFRLERGGGTLRVCQAHPRIVALLDQVRFPMLVDVYPTLDEAVLDAWPDASGRSVVDG